MKQNIIVQLKGFWDDKLLDLYREFLTDQKRWEDSIYFNDEDFVNEYFECPNDAVRAVCHGNYRFNDDYCRINAYGNLESTPYLHDWIPFDEVAEWLIDNPRMLDQYGIEIEED